MHNERKIGDGLYYLGGSDRRIGLFENFYPAPLGMSYNSYLFLDEKTCLLDTVDKAISHGFFENLEHALNGRPLDYLVVHHMEPDHAAEIGELLLRHPETTIVLSAMAKKMLLNFYPGLQANTILAKEGDELKLGEHTLRFLMAPMVHWPEVMFSFEESTKTLFSADAFGCFGALSGNLYDPEHRTFPKEEYRRYYCNIVGKYGPQVLAALKKVAPLGVKLICPLHGPLHQEDIPELLEEYTAWASYTPEDKDGVMIVYGSIYGDTENAAEILAADLADRGVKNLTLYDVSRVHVSTLVSEAFRVKTIVLMSASYNMGVYIKMEDFLHDLAAHKLANRTFAIVENGSWAPSAKNAMKSILEGLPNSTYLEPTLTITSALKESDLPVLEQIADAVASSVKD